MKPYESKFMTNSDTRPTGQGETRREVAERIAEHFISGGSRIERTLQVDTLRRKACANAIEAALKEREGCQHCTCTCDSCAPCGEDQG